MMSMYVENVTFWSQVVRHLKQDNWSMVEKSGRTFYIQYLAYLLLGDLMCSGQVLKGKASN